MGEALHGGGGGEGCRAAKGGMNPVGGGGQGAYLGIVYLLGLHIEKRRERGLPPFPSSPCLGGGGECLSRGRRGGEVFAMGERGRSNFLWE
jgi:hypothetical protein